MANGSIGRTIAPVLALLLAACSAGRGGSIPYSSGDFAAPDAPKLMTADDSYRFAPLDVVTVAVFQVPELSREYTIDQGGHLTMPLVGSIEAVGLNTTQLAKKISDALGAKYLRDPDVTVALKSSESRVFTVDGSVRQPGVYQMTSGTSLLKAIAVARGVDELANPHRVAIFRTISGKRMAAAFDLTSIQRGQGDDPAIYAGDTIVVDGSGVKSAQRNVLNSIPLASIFVALAH